MISQLDVSFSFWFRNPFVDPRQAKCTVEQSNLAPKFQIQQTEVSDNHYEVTWCIYTTLTKEEATPLDVSGLEATEDQAWMKEQTKASRSVTITVRNSTSASFYRKKFELNRGSWTCLPPDVFLPGKTVSFGAKGSSLMTGTTGRVVYQSETSNEALEIFYDNPFIGDIQVVHSRPIDFRLDVAYRKQEHLRVNVGIFPVSESAEMEKEMGAEAAVVSSSPSSSASSALPLHKIQTSVATKQSNIAESSVQQKTPTTARSTRLPPNQLVSGEEDEEDATIAATSRRESRTSMDASSPRSKSRRQVADDASPVVPKLRRQGTSEKLTSSSSRVSLDLGMPRYSIVLRARILLTLVPIPAPSSQRCSFRTSMSLLVSTKDWANFVYFYRDCLVFLCLSSSRKKTGARTCPKSFPKSAATSRTTVRITPFLSVMYILIISSQAPNLRVYLCSQECCERFWRFGQSTSEEMAPHPTYLDSSFTLWLLF
jgi:hypothetical protein